MRKWHTGVVWLVLGLVLVPLMPSNQSLWIDEGFTLPYAQESSFSQFRSRLANETGSEALMPLGMFSTWLGAKVFGTSEIGLRGVSALWAAVAVLLLWRTGVLVGLPWLGALLACHPFLWYYAGEVRPYAMVIAMSAGLSYALVAALSCAGNQNRAFHALLLFGPLLCATQVLGLVPFVVVAALIGVTLIRRGWKPRTRDLAALVSSGTVVLVLGLYYGKAISTGADVNWAGPWKVGINNLLFSGYELLGFTGLGPGRYELRQGAMEGGMRGLLGVVSPASIVALTVLVLVYALILVRWRVASRREEAEARRLKHASGLAIVLAAGVIFGLCVAVGSTFWGRHLASLLPFFVLAVGIASVATGGASELRRYGLTFVLAGVLLGSSLLVRFDPDHQRDDYRGASRIALADAHDGRVVWWAAADQVARYYGVEFCDSAARPDSGACVHRAVNLQPEAIERLVAADVVVISKPELHDIHAAVRGYIAENRLRSKRRLMAFEVYEAP